MSVILSIIAGVAMTIQGVFNTNVQEKIGLSKTTVLVQATALLVSIIALFFSNRGSFSEIRNVNKLYLLGGAIGVVITYTVMASISTLGVSSAIGIILIAQLASAALVNAFGLFGAERVSMAMHDYLGLGLMLIGIIILKFTKF